MSSSAEPGEKRQLADLGGFPEHERKTACKLQVWVDVLRFERPGTFISAFINRKHTAKSTTAPSCNMADPVKLTVSVSLGSGLSGARHIQRRDVLDRRRLEGM